MLDQHSTAAWMSILRERRTISQASLSIEREPNHHKVLEAIESARWAPNHHKTEPWTFYLLDPSRIVRLGELWADIHMREGAKPETVERKRREWGQSKGVVILTCTSAPDADETTRKENYAACCCAAQNFMLHLWSEGIGSKWSTGVVWQHEAFWALLGLDTPQEHTDVVGLFFYGIPAHIPKGQRHKSLTEIVVDFRNLVQT